MKRFKILLLLCMIFTCKLKAANEITVHIFLSYTNKYVCTLCIHELPFIKNDNFKSMSNGNKWYEFMNFSHVVQLQAYIDLNFLFGKSQKV